MTANSGLAEPALCATRHVRPADRVPHQPAGYPRRLAAVLWREETRI